MVQTYAATALMDSRDMPQPSPAIRSAIVRATPLQHLGTLDALLGGMDQNTEMVGSESNVLPCAKPTAGLFDYHGRILLAEDDDDTRDALLGALELDGHEIIEAANARQLLEALSGEAQPPRRGRPFDLLITDLRMPGWSGIQSLARLRRAYWTRPIIVITAFSEEETRQEVERLGAVLFDKPFDLDDLRTAVFFLLRKTAIG